MKPAAAHRSLNSGSSSTAAATTQLRAFALATRHGLANLSRAVGPGADLFVTFASASLLPFVRNWASQFVERPL